MLKWFYRILISTVWLWYGQAYAVVPDALFSTTNNQYGMLQIFNKASKYCSGSDPENTIINPLFTGCDVTTTTTKNFAFTTIENQSYDLETAITQNYKEHLNYNTTKNIYYFREDHLGKDNPQQYINIILPEITESQLENITYTIAANKNALEEYLRKELVSISIGTPEIIQINAEEKPMPEAFYANPNQLKEGDLGIRIVDMATENHQTIFAITKIKTKRTMDAPFVAQDVALISFPENLDEPTKLDEIPNFPVERTMNIEGSKDGTILFKITNNHFANGTSDDKVKAFLTQDFSLFSNTQGTLFADHYIKLWDFIYNPKRIVMIPVP